MAQNPLLKGVGGWLLLLSVILTIVLPLTFLAGMGSTAELIEVARGKFPGFAGWLMFSEVIYLLMIGYSAYTGALLWKGRKGAATRAQYLLLACFCVAAFNLVVPFVSDLPPALRGQLADLNGRALLKTTVFVVLWHQYLARSVRVRNTYGLSIASGASPSGG